MTHKFDSGFQVEEYRDPLKRARLELLGLRMKFAQVDKRANQLDDIIREIEKLLGY